MYMFLVGSAHTHTKKRDTDTTKRVSPKKGSFVSTRCRIEIHAMSTVEVNEHTLLENNGGGCCWRSRGCGQRVASFCRLSEWVAFGRVGG